MSDAESAPNDTDPDTADGRDALPDDWEAMSQEEKEAWADEREQALAEQAEEAARLSDDEQEALDALSEPIESDTEEVELNGQTVRVKSYLDAEREDNLNHIEENRQDFDEIRGTLADTMAWLIEDDRYGGEKGKKVWRAYAEKFGVSSLAELFYKAVEPALDRMENSEAAQRFRQDGQGAGRLPSGR